MPEVTVTYKNNKSLKALQDLAKAYDMVIETPDAIAKLKRVPITFAEESDPSELWGIWKDNPMTLEELRKRAWGDRL